MGVMNELFNEIIYREKIFGNGPPKKHQDHAFNFNEHDANIEEDMDLIDKNIEEEHPPK